MSRWWPRIIRGSASLLFGQIIFLALRHPPLRVWWYVRIGVTEWGYLLAPLMAAMLVRPWRRTLGFPAWALGGVAGALGAWPVLRAVPIARELEARLTAAFGPATPRSSARAAPRPAPLIAVDLLRGIAAPEVRTERMPYARRGARDLMLDLYLPRANAATSALPLVLVIHGGAWETGDSRQLPALNFYLAARGYAVAAINYRLAPHHRFPAALHDVRAALDFFKAHGARWRIDAARIVLLGRSAGGHLALLAAYADADPAIRGVVGLYAPADLAWGYANPGNRRVIDIRRVLKQFLGGAPAEAAQVYAEASPVSYLGAHCPPTLLIHGDMDEMVAMRHSDLVVAGLARYQRPHLLLKLPWAAHGCDANLAGPSGQLSTYAIERFLAAVMEA